MKPAPSRTYQLLDSGHFMKLEQVGPFRISRPSACAVWDPVLPASEWKKVDAEFQRRSDGTGDWKISNPKIKESWPIEIQGIVMNMKLTGFGHLGIFAEQEKNWVQIREIVSKEVASRGASAESFRVLNLFAYTGGSTLFSSAGGAEVVHLDASKTSVQWARENAESSGLGQNPIRWIVDDVQEFVDKEVRRGRTYHGLILDPPSFGRGAKNQMWKIEEHLLPLLKHMTKIMDDDFSFLLLSGHSPGYTPVSFTNQLKQICEPWVAKRRQAGAKIEPRYESGEMVILDKTGKSLPSGAYGLFQAVKLKD